MPDRQPRISVVIPAFNAAFTLDETLRGARSQTCSEIEIIVVDDGSTDATAEIAQAHAARDGRMRVHVQENSGVAAARNTGAAMAKADWVAFLDADDLWAPTKLAKQLASVARLGPSCALSYTRFSLIDERGEILLEDVGGDVEGHTLEALYLGNFIGNGSSPLVSREALLETGGFNTDLRSRGAQGCEDYELYLRLAGRWTYALVAEPLTGYRVASNNMSSDIRRMYRSFAMVSRETERRHPHLRRTLKQGRMRYLQHLLHAARSRKPSVATLQAAARLLAMSPRHFVGTLLLLSRPHALGPALRPRFHVADPDRSGELTRPPK
jgi:glycosyltransferase involved in cell wall biosynthesis